jgi:hypothetical protein
LGSDVISYCSFGGRTAADPVERAAATTAKARRTDPIGRAVLRVIGSIISFTG